MRSTLYASVLAVALATPVSVGAADPAPGEFAFSGDARMGYFGREREDRNGSRSDESDWRIRVRPGLLWQVTPTLSAKARFAGRYSTDDSNDNHYEFFTSIPQSDGLGFGDSTIDELNLRYKAGNLDVGYGYQENANQLAASNLEYNTVGAAYNFGSFRVSGGWNQVKNKASRKSDAYSIGAIVPVGAFDFSLGYSTAKAKQGSATFEKGDAFSAAVAYNLSKRTRVYAGLTTGDIEDAAGTKVREREVYALGLAHTF